MRMLWLHFGHKHFQRFDRNVWNPFAVIKLYVYIFPYMCLYARILPFSYSPGVETAHCCMRNQAEVGIMLLPVPLDVLLNATGDVQLNTSFLLCLVYGWTSGNSIRWFLILHGAVTPHGTHTRRWLLVTHFIVELNRLWVLLPQYSNQ